MTMNSARPLILASSSPRRVELMQEAGFAFEVMVPGVEEVHDEALTCEDLTVENARLKARAVARLRPEALVIGADTLVYLDEVPITKPRDMEEAAAMLRDMVADAWRASGEATLGYKTKASIADLEAGKVDPRSLN